MPEGEERNSMEIFVETFLSETLEISESTDLQIERAHTALVVKQLQAKAWGKKDLHQ